MCSLNLGIKIGRGIVMAKLAISSVTLLTALLLLVVVEVNGEDSFPSSICVTWLLKEECTGGDRALTSTDVKFTINYTVSGETRSRFGPVLTKNNEELKIYNLTYPNSFGGRENPTRQAEYYFEQLEHGGGWCNCLHIFINCRTGGKKQVTFYVIKMISEQNSTQLYELVLTLLFEPMSSLKQ